MNRLASQPDGIIYPTRNRRYDPVHERAETKESSRTQTPDIAMKHLAIATLISTIAATCSADIVVFKENFEANNLNQWTGKSGGPTSGAIVADPLNPANKVLTFLDVNFAGDIFTSQPIDTSLNRRYVLKFDFLGTASDRQNGAFIGLSDAPAENANQFWIASTYPDALTAPAHIATELTADNTWRRYQIDITDLVSSNGLAQAFIMLQDWFDFGSVAGDVYFDNISVTAEFDVDEILNQIPCGATSHNRHWRNHGQYIAAVARLTLSYVKAGIITREEAGEVMSAAARNDCGKPQRNKFTCNHPGRR